MIDKLLDPNERPRYAPGLLSVQFVHGTAFDQAKKFLEQLGFNVFDVSEEALSWEYRTTIPACIPSEPIEEWIARLESESIIQRASEVSIRSIAEN